MTATTNPIVANPNGNATAITNPVSTNGIIYEYNKGTFRPRQGINPSRITTQLAIWLDLKATAPTSLSAANTCTTDTTRNLMRNSAQLFTQTSVSFTQNYWTINLAMPANGLLVVPIYMEDYITLGATCAFNIKLVNAGGTITYKFAGDALKPDCWNQLPLWNPATDAAAAFHRPGACEVTSNTGFNFGANATQLTIEPTNFVAGQIHAIASVETMPYITPVAVVTIDQQDASTFDTPDGILATMEANGFRAGIRLGGFTDSDYIGSGITNRKTAYANGHDIINGTWSRGGFTKSTTEAAFSLEILACHNRVVSLGFSRGMTWLGGSGNALPSAKVTRSVGPMLGYKVFKAGGGAGIINVVGSSGVDDPYYLGVNGLGGSVSPTVTGTTGNTTCTVSSSSSLRIGQLCQGSGFAANTRITGIANATLTVSPALTGDMAAVSCTFRSDLTTYQKMIDGLIYTGGLLVFFIHLLNAGATDDSALGKADWAALMAYIKTKTDASLMNVYTPSQCDLFLEGEL